MNALLGALLCALLFASALPASADVGRDEAAAAAQRVAGARVLAVERADVGAKPVWRVKVLSAQGEVCVVIVDAAFGPPEMGQRLAAVGRVRSAIPAIRSPKTLHPG